MDDFLLHNLREALLNASTQNGQQLFIDIVDAIQKTTGSRMCSLWSINNNNTNGFQSASLIVRKLEEGLYPSNNYEDYVQDLSESFIKRVLLQTEKTKLPYYFSYITDEKHRSRRHLGKLDLNDFLGIPIPNQEKTKTIALLKLSFINDPQIEQIELFSTIIRDMISSCFYRYMLLKNQQVMEELVKNYQEKGTEKNIENIFGPILQTILRKYCDYEGASFFMWDSYMNHYKLISTTGIIDTINKDDYQKIYYQAGEGLTGNVADKKKSIIYDNLDDEEQNVPDYKHRFIETTKHIGKTMLVVPIFRPSKKDEIIGILRFINKINPVNSDVVDFFNDTDEEIISYVSKYLALIIDYFLAEEERNDFIAKLSHEFSTPANSIRITADRIKNNMGDSLFMRTQFNHYIQSIIYFSEFQLQQINTNLHLSKVRRNIPYSLKYYPSQILLKDVIYKSRILVIPIAREAGVKFDNIKIDEKFPSWHLFVDDTAFTTVFYNLLTNAIKYHKHNYDFYVNITGYETNDNLIINVSDYGLGIEQKDTNKIFLLGFRGENVTRINSNGFGIGMSVIKQIINDFGGKIRVAHLESPTTFEIKLPKKLFNNNYINSKEWTQ
jgi:signal transduction histidine kinase